MKRFFFGGTNIKNKNPTFSLIFSLQHPATGDVFFLVKLKTLNVPFKTRDWQHPSKDLHKMSPSQLI